MTRIAGYPFWQLFVGKTIGRLMVVITPGGFEKYLEEIGGYSPATDMQKIIEISDTASSSISNRCVTEDGLVIKRR